MEFRDAELIYGKKSKRKRKTSNKSSSSEMEVTTLDSSSIKREKAKKRRALIQAQYDDITQKSEGTPPSLHNETLTSLQGSEKSSKHSIPISYNIYAQKEVLKKINRHHLHKHSLDFGSDLKCHKLSYRKISHKHRTSPYILSLNKIYSILYLALLIIKDKIQLGDILRFMKEGYLTFNNYNNLLPDDFTEKKYNFKNGKKNIMFTNSNLRQSTTQIAKFLKVDWFLVCPNLIELCERYCKELNLPEAICDCVKNIISRTNIKMLFCNYSDKVPNYEGRVLSIIIFVLKLLFGLDDVTELYLGDFAKKLNKSSQFFMFDIVEWLKYIEGRALGFKDHPSGEEIKHLDTLIVLLNTRNHPENNFNKIKDDFSQLLNKLKSKPNTIDLPCSLTPFIDSLSLLKSVSSDINPILQYDFTKSSLDFILNPNVYKKLANNNKPVQVINGGANNNWIIEKLTCPEQDNKRNLQERKKIITVELTLKPLKNQTPNKIETSERDPEKVRKDFQDANSTKFHQNSKHIDTLTPTLDFKPKLVINELKNIPETYTTHYNPYERYWIFNKMRIEALNRKDFLEFFDKFPNNFKIVFKECQRIAQQSEQEFFTEFQLTELHLVYNQDFLSKFGKNILNDVLLKKFIKKTNSLW